MCIWEKARSPTVGSIIPSKGAIIPAAMGVDIGRGTNAVRLSITAHDLSDNLAKIRLAIEAVISLGFNQHETDRARASSITALHGGLERIRKKHPTLLHMQRQPQQSWVRRIGSLGGGNHFIE